MRVRYIQWMLKCKLAISEFLLVFSFSSRRGGAIIFRETSERETARGEEVKGVRGTGE